MEQISNTYKPLLLDIMYKGRFICQMKYNGIPFPKVIDGKVVPTYDSRDILRFVYQQRPSLIDKDIKVMFSNQKL